MVSEQFKMNINKAVELIESCFDENNKCDGLTFDERLEKVINECEDEDLKSILINAKEFWIRDDKMNDIENILQTLTYAEKEYRRQKTELENKTNKLLLTTPWDKINEERKEKGLQKISNDTLRKAYIDEQLIKERKNLDKIENRRKQLLRKYEIDLELFKYELQLSLTKQGGKH